MDMNAQTTGLSWVDYSDIQVEFDELADAGCKMGARMSKFINPAHMGGIEYTALDIRKQCGFVVSHVFRAEQRIYGGMTGTQRPFKNVRLGASLAKPGFIDAVHSIVKDVDVYDPVEEVNTFLKFMLIRQDFIGGSCHHCKANNSTIIGVRGQAGYMYVYKCNRCYRQFSPKTGTFLHRASMGLPTAFDVLRMALDPVGIPYREIARKAKVAINTAYDFGWLCRSHSLGADRWPGEHFGVDRADRKSHTAAGASRANPAKDKASTLPQDGGEPQRDPRP